MSSDVILELGPLGFPWSTLDPFLFCVHHDDAYPAGNEKMGPDASLSGRNMGQDFGGRDGWSMYHGMVVPGFPRHPHRGFETVTIARRGYIDHSDSLGATARFGQGDVQWMTAGRGVEHSEMFPLLRREEGNPTELFQIWLNLPRSGKRVDAHFTMLWDETIPRVNVRDDEGRETVVTVAAGTLGDATPPSPPPNSWASSPESDIAIWTIRMEPGAQWTVPAARADSNRVLYFFEGSSVEVAGRSVDRHLAIRVKPDAEVPLVAGDQPVELLLLQGRPIGEPVVQYGPFVMNTQGEIRQAMIDYQNGEFGRWPWPSDAPVHARESGRFAVHADGRRETPNP